MTTESLLPAEAVRRCQNVFAHAWMVRTFVKHSPEAEEFPELMPVVRTVFDVSRSLESRVDDPEAYFRQLRKKMKKLRDAAIHFEREAPLASDHTNFKQAVQSMNACVEELQRILNSVTLGVAPESPSSIFHPARALDATSLTVDDSE